MKMADGDKLIGRVKPRACASYILRSGVTEERLNNVLLCMYVHRAEVKEKRREEAGNIDLKEIACMLVAS